MVEIFDVSFGKIEVIKDLWEKNRLYHEKSSQYFSEAYRCICFEDKIKYFKGMDEDTLKITVAKDGENLLGYCISTIIDGRGEMASIHVDQSRRGTGIGKKLVVEHLKWMKDKKCKAIGVTVSQENDSTIGFYKKLGFYPNTIYMQQKIINKEDI